MRYIKYIKVAIFFVIFIIFTFLMKSTSDILNANLYNIVDYEMLWSYEKYQTVMTYWSTTEIQAAKTNTFLDFGWLVGYGGLIYTLNSLLAEKLNGKTKKLVHLAAIGGILALSLDIVENVFLLNMLYKTNMVFKGLPLIVSIIASLKFLFVIASIFIFVIGLVVFIIKCIKTKKQISKT
jgi:hypothetical protein